MIWYVLVFAPIYMLPAIVAFSRKHESKWLITVMTALTAWTGIGWLACGVWAFIDKKKQDEAIRPAQ